MLQALWATMQSHMSRDSWWNLWCLPGNNGLPYVHPYFDFFLMVLNIVQLELHIRTLEKLR